MADPDPDPLPVPSILPGPTLDAILHAVYCLPTRHPFQLGRSLGTNGPHEVVYMGNQAIIRLDMPGVSPDSGFTRTNKPELNRISFTGMAPEMGMDPYDEPARAYGGFLQLPNDCDPNLINIVDKHEDGSFFLGFLNSTVRPSIFGLPFPKIPPPPPPVRKGQVLPGSSSSRGFEDGCPEAIYERANNQPEASTSAPSGRKTRKTRKARKTRQPVEEPPSKSKGLAAWVRAFLARNLFGVNVPDPPKDEPPPIVVTPSIISRHGAPETAIGAVVKFHSPTCSCAGCKPEWYLETLTTTKDIIGYDNPILFRGPLGVCEKRLIQEKDGSYALYVRADLPGLPPKLCKVEIQDRRVVVFGSQAGEEAQLMAPRAYFFFVQLECSCFKFIRAVHAGFSLGILRMLCKIIPAYADEKYYKFP